MRPKFVLALIVVAVLVLAAAFYHRQAAASHQPPAPADSAAVTAASARLAAAADSAASNSPDGLAPAPVAVLTPAARPLTPEEKQDYVEAEKDRLHDWSTQNDPAALAGIVNDLTNSDKEVRLAAIEATKQYGSRDAIPALQDDVASAADTDEKIALLQAADFLALPTVAEVNDQTPRTPEQLQAMEQSRQKSAARKQYLMQKHAQNQNGVPPPPQNPPPQ